MENPTETPKKKSPLLYVALAVVAVAAVLGIKQVYHSLTHESTDNAQIETYTLPVLSRIAGYVDSIQVNDFGTVTKGQSLVVIDSREYQLSIAQAEADLLSAQAEYASAEASQSNAGAGYQVALANKEVQQIRTDKALKDLKRDQALLADGSITQKQLDDTKSNYDAAVKMMSASGEQVALAHTQSSSASAQMKRAQALIETRKALLDQAKLKLSYTNITAPVDGRIGKRNLNPGQYVQPGQTLFTIVNNETFWVVANFKETQLKNLKAGEQVDIIIDGYPDRKVTGKIGSFSEATGARFALLPPDNASGNFVKVTQRVPVRIDIDNLKENQDILKAGLSVTVEVKI